MTPLEKKDYGQRLLRFWLGREVAVEALKCETSADTSAGKDASDQKTARIHKALSVVKWKTQLERWIRDEL